MSNELKIETLGPIEADERAAKYERIRAWQEDEINKLFLIPSLYFKPAGFYTHVQESRRIRDGRKYE